MAEFDENEDLPVSREYDASDPAKVGERSKKAKERALRINDGFKQLLDTKNGRAWLWDLLSTLRPFETVFTQPDQLVIAYNSGKKDVGLSLLAKLTTPQYMGHFTLMMEEANE